MNYWLVWAVILNTEVKNVLVGEQQKVLEVAQAMYGNDVFLICVNEPDIIPVQEGDTYTNGKFHRDGVELGKYPTQETTIDNLKSTSRSNTTDISRLQDAIDDVIITILEEA